MLHTFIGHPEIFIILTTVLGSKGYECGPDFLYPDPHLDRQKKSEKKTKHLEELDVLYGGLQASWRSWKKDFAF